jgi:Spy/CpxP family protein refolding chaperone
MNNKQIVKPNNTIIMKRIKIFAAMALMTGLMITTGEVFAQRGQGRGATGNGSGKGMMYNADGQGMMNNGNRQYRADGQCMLDLTDEQEAKITELRTNHLKEVTPLRNELNEKRARLHTLQSADKHDLNAINKTIDEMSSIRTNIQKKGAAHRAEVASLLTDEQRVLFNSRKSNRMNRGNGKMGHGGRGRF